MSRCGAIPASGLLKWERLKGVDDLEVLVVEHVVWPADADVLDVVIPVAQLYNTVHDGEAFGGQLGDAARAELDALVAAVQEGTQVGEGAGLFGQLTWSGSIR